jgi:hypothetical protein
VPHEVDLPEDTYVKELTVSKTVHNEQETYTKETCSSELESFQTDNTNSDSNSSGDSELNRTLLDIDMASLNDKLEEYNKSNKNLVSSI